MYNLLSFEFIFFFIYSFIAIFFSIFIPGSLAIRFSKYSLPPLLSFVLPFVAGTAIWVFLGFVIGFLNIRFLSYAYVIGCAMVWFFLNRKIRPRLGISKSMLPVAGLITLGALMQMTFGIFMGVQEAKGISFCCIDASDNLYFLSLSNEIV